MEGEKKRRIRRERGRSMKEWRREGDVKGENEGGGGEAEMTGEPPGGTARWAAVHALLRQMDRQADW